MRLGIRTRLTLVSAALMALLLTALGVFLYVRLRTELIHTVDAGLRSRAEVLAHRTGTDLAGGGLVDPGDAFAQVLAADGRVIASSPGLVGTPLLRPEEVTRLEAARFIDADVRTVEETVPARLLAVPSSDGGAVVVGASLDDQQEALGRLRTLLLIGGPVALILAGGIGWLLAGAAIRPVERMRTEAEAISGSEPGRRLAVPETGDELARLGESLNRMLGRLEETVERERRFVDDASHELRTPLANLKAELELALRRARTQEELASALRSASEETERLSRLAQDLLVLARADRGRLPVRREDVDVARLLRETVAGFSGRAAELGLSLEPTAEHPERAELDGVRLRQAVGNLIDNALRHTPRGGRVTVDLTREDGALSISVADTGGGFDPAFLARAFEPFSRVDAVRGRSDGGTGLGLAIVRAVAEAHGGTVEAGNRPEGGAVVILRIPG